MNILAIILHPLKYYECFITCVIVFIITPSIFTFEMSIVRPKLVADYNIGPFKHYVHIVCGTFCFMNVVGNMMLSIFTDSKLTISQKNGVYCSTCNMYRPMGSWHCSRCNACIVRRDHHCFFLSRCIGLNNRRYYILYLGHIMISMVYSLYYNSYFVSSLFKDDGMYISAIRILNPLVRYMVPVPMDYRDIFVLLLFLNVAILLWSSFLFWTHMLNVLRGLTAYESKTSKGNIANWRENLKRVFGEKWLLTMMFPFLNSPLPEANVILPDSNKVQ